MSLRNTARNALAGETLDPQMVDEAIYGSSSLDALNTGRVVAKPTPISSIWADVRQPRRAVPISIRLHWNGSPDDVAALLAQWHRVATAAAARDINIVDVLTGQGEGVETDNTPSLFRDYVDLLRLAQSIHADGLVNPITLASSDGRLLIESGERRWLAHHLLAQHVDEKYSRIPATVGDGRDFVWRQASENTARRQLNAIGMARQLALLIMATREVNGETYQPFEDIVRNGTCDRRFYAQVADGTSHSVPRGQGERIQGAMGLGKEQLSQYRKLLRLTDDEMVNDILWMQADIDNWPEGWLREAGRLTPVNLRQVIQQENWTIEDLRAIKETPAPAPTVTGSSLPGVPTEFRRGMTVWTTTGMEGRVTAINGRMIRVMTRIGEQDHFANRLSTTAPEPVPPPIQLSSPPTPQATKTPQPAQATSTFEQHMGELVQVVETEQTGVLGRKRPDGKWSVRIGSNYLGFDEEELLLLNVMPDANPTPTHTVTEKAAGEFETDNTPSLPYPVIAVNSPLYRLLSGLRAAAMAVDNEAMVALFDSVINVTNADAEMMADAGEMSLTLDGWYQQIEVFFATLLAGDITTTLQGIHQAGMQ